MRFGTDELGTDEIGTDGLVNLRLVKPRCTHVWGIVFAPNNFFNSINFLTTLIECLRYKVERNAAITFS
jgi:hypothetical protein